MIIANKVKDLAAKARQKKLFFIIPFAAILVITIIYGVSKKPLHQLKTKIKIEDSFGVEPIDNEILSRALSKAGLLNSNRPLDSISWLRQKITLVWDQPAGILEIMITGHNPKKMSRLVNEVSKIYVAEVNLKVERINKRLIGKRESELEEYKASLKDKLLDAKKKLEDYEQRIEAVRLAEEKDIGKAVTVKSRLMELEIERAELLRIYTEVHPDVVRVNSEIDNLKKQMDLLPLEPKGRIQLERELSDHQKVYSALKDKWDEASLKRIEELKGLKVKSAVISDAEEEAYPVDLTRRNLIFILGITVSFLAGLGSLAAVVFLDTSLLTPEQVYTFTHLPVLGAVPYLKPRLLKSTKIKEKSSLILGWEDNSEVIEPYRTLYNNILSDIFQGQMDNKSILLTSSTAGESKTIIASNLALVMAKMGRRVLLVDANFINPSVHRVFGIESRMSGFTDLLNKGTDFKAAIRDVTDILLGNIGLEAALKFKGLDRLKLVTAGSPVSDPGGLLKSENTNLVIEEFKKRFDCVILDGPAISASADSLSLAAHCEATFIVYSVGKTPRKSLKSALIQAGDTQEAGAGGGMAVKGVIVNLCI